MGLIGLLMSDPVAFVMLSMLLLYSVILHELAHGWVAYRMGDATAKWLGRLTLNPLKHLDPIGSLMLLIIGFGWAKPVPINSQNLPDPQFDEVKVAIAGPLTNLGLAIIAAGLARVLPMSSLTDWLVSVVQLNLVLALFNLVPIPPLDGSRLLAVILPESVYHGLQRINTVVAFLVLFVLIQSAAFSDWLGRTVGYLATLLLGKTIGV